MESAGQWLEKALNDLCQRVETGLNLDRDVISGLVSYCELAQPVDAKEYLDNIVGQEAGKNVIGEYLRRRGYVDSATSSSVPPASKFHAYVKPASEKGPVIGAKKPFNASKNVPGSDHQHEPKKVNVPSHKVEAQKNSASKSLGNGVPDEAGTSSQIGGQGSSKKKKKSGKVISLEEAKKGSIVFQQGKPCSCQARRHRLVSNCLSCGKIVCEQEGEGPCCFCGALVLKEGSSYAGLEGVSAPVSDSEAAAEAYAKRLVDYDRDAASRTTVIDDQSDYYEIEGNSWLSKEEKELLMKKQEEIAAAEQAKRSKVVVTFDLVGRKVLVNEDEVPEIESENRILRPSDGKEREVNRIKPNPSVKIQPIFLDPGPSKKSGKDKQQGKRSGGTGICLAITGRVQHDNKDMKKKYVMEEDQMGTSRNGKQWHAPAVGSSSCSSMRIQDDNECSLDYD